MRSECDTTVGNTSLPVTAGNTALSGADRAVMRHLTLAAALLATGVAVAATAGADPSPTPAPPTESATATPTESATATPSESATSTPTSTVAGSAGSHQVTYTVTTTSDLTANMYYVTADPPDQASANKPQYMPMARTQVGPGAPWSFQANLNDPTQWAFVSASGGLRVNPEFRCEISVDGQVVVSQQGGSGVQCALRPW